MGCNGDRDAWDTRAWPGGPVSHIEVVDEPSRWGFAYGTLPGHPEQGEETSVVSISGDGSVRLEITAFSRPGDPTVRLLGPPSRGIQTAAMYGYLRALQQIVAQGGWNTGGIPDRRRVGASPEPGSGPSWRSSRT